MDHTDVELAAAWAAEIGRDFSDESMPFQVRRLRRTIRKWAAQIVAWHQSHEEPDILNHQRRRRLNGDSPAMIYAVLTAR